ncbi:MAG: hypothetical protein HGB37_01475 [Candidatus Moranbacteria bacterium]|nr:hypothetical protein [Candidatus Moranbacteria bacterium]
MQAFKKGLILPDVKRKWLYNSEKMVIDLLGTAGAPIFRLNVIDRRSLLVKERGCDEMPILLDLQILFRSSESRVLDGLPGFTVDRRAGSGGLLFMYCDPGIKVRFPRKSNPVMAIDMETKTVNTTPFVGTDGYCWFEHPTELVVALDQGGRVESARDFREKSKVRCVRFSCKDFILLY